MVDRGRGYPTQPDRDHWCYPGILWELDADLTTQPLYFVIPASFHFRLDAEERPCKNSITSPLYPAGVLIPLVSQIFSRAAMAPVPI